MCRIKKSPKKQICGPLGDKQKFEVGRKQDAGKSKAQKTSNHESMRLAEQVRNQANNMAKFLKRDYYDTENSNIQGNSRKLWSLARGASPMKKQHDLTILF